MEIERGGYVKSLADRKNNGAIKVITGVRRCGKSYLLFRLYKKYLLTAGFRKFFPVNLTSKKRNTCRSFLRASI